MAAYLEKRDLFPHLLTFHACSVTPAAGSRIAGVLLDTEAPISILLQIIFGSVNVYVSREFCLVFSSKYSEET